MHTESVSFYNSINQRLSGTLYLPDAPSQKGLIYAHGLFSSKNGYKITRLAPELADAGFSVMTFDFSCIGESEGAPEDLSILQEIDDLAAAVRYFRDYGMDRIHLIGSSMGGLVSLVHASWQPCSVDSLILLATPVRLDPLFRTMVRDIDVAELPESGFTRLQGMPIRNRFFRELTLLHPHELLAGILPPALIIHGEEDAVVPVADARLIFDSLAGIKKLVLIPGGDHNLVSDREMGIIRSALFDWISRPAYPSA